MGWGLGKLKKEGQLGDMAEEHQEVVGKARRRGRRVSQRCTRENL